MKILNKEIDIGDIVMIEEKYHKNYHYLKHNRIHVGMIEFMDSSKNLSLSRKRLIDPKDVQINKFRDFFKIFYQIGIANYGIFGNALLNEKQMSSITILSKGGVECLKRN